MNVPAELKYTNDHEWLRIEGNTGIIGITDFAQSELGDVVFVDIDPDTKNITSGSSFGTIEAVKTVSELLAPVDGNVVEINSKLQDEPQLVNTDPYGEGWLLKIEIIDPAQVSELLDSESYKQQLA
ncbi:MAG: glycine cleavage system protein GcvH [Bacteroidetes bacterium]|nr:glycine cleavage system protein GcvH [Bacteroidota bacterium]